MPYKNREERRKYAREYCKQRRARDPAYAKKIRAYARARYAADAPGTKTYQRERSKRNRAKANAARRKYYARNRDKELARNRQHRGLPLPLRPEPNACESCGRPETARRQNGLSVDHCHTTGLFRGWLCSRCNTAIGMVGDSLDGVNKLRDYLLKYSGGTK